MDWTKTNDTGFKDNYIDYCTLEPEGNIDNHGEQRQSHKQDSDQPNNASCDNRDASSNSKTSQSYANQMENASKALALAFENAQKLPQNTSFSPIQSDSHVHPQNHFLQSLGSQDLSQTVMNADTSINKLLSDTTRLLDGVRQNENQQQPSSRDQNYDPIDASFPLGDARDSSGSLDTHLIRSDRHENNGNFSQLHSDSHQLQPYPVENNILDNLLGDAFNAQNVNGTSALHLVRTENSVTDGSNTSSYDISRSGSSNHRSLDGVRRKSHPVNQQTGGFSEPTGELQTNFLQAQNPSNFLFSGMSNHKTMDGIKPRVFNAGKTSETQNQERQNAKQSSRNEREQQRAAKISGVIDELRNTMVQGGWKIEMKSKYQVLSTSTEYLRHLIKSTQEKESALVKAREELKIRNQKLDEERVLQDGYTDDSLTSSLTQSFAGTHSLEERGKGSIGNGDSSTDVAVASMSPGRDSSKRKMPSECFDEGEKTSKKEKHGDDDSNHGSNSTGNLESNNVIAMHKMSSSLSDVTDSNRCSSDGQGTNGSSDGQVGAGDREVKEYFDLSLLVKEESDTSKTTDNSVSTTGAVVSREDELSGEHKHASIIFTKDRKRKYSEKTSMDEGFQLSYQEIFLSSNVPQMIATPSGRIVACNDFFFRVTGLTEKDVKKVTIFSMVRVDRLSALFELVAEALRRSNAHDVSKTSSSEESSKSNSILTSGCAGSSGNSQGTHDRNSDSRTEEREPSLETLEFETESLPCVSFPNVLTNEKDGQVKKLYMNVTFMFDENPLKRCIHCALTDQPGARGKVGNITPELLSMVFPSDS